MLLYEQMSEAFWKCSWIQRGYILHIRSSLLLSSGPTSYWILGCIITGSVLRRHVKMKHIPNCSGFVKNRRNQSPAGHTMNPFTTVTRQMAGHSLYWSSGLLAPIMSRELQNHTYMYIYMSLETMELCFHNIVFLCWLPSHTSNALWPCNVGVIRYWTG